LIGTPFATYSSDIANLARTNTDINWTTQEEAKYRLLTNTGAGAAVNTIENAAQACYSVFSAVCDWNLIMMSNDIVVPNQCYSTKNVLND
jgi:hypothetical protein